VWLICRARLRGDEERLCGCWKAEGFGAESWRGSGIVDREIGVKQSRVVDVMWNWSVLDMDQGSGMVQRMRMLLLVWSIQVWKRFVVGETKLL